MVNCCSSNGFYVYNGHCRYWGKDIPNPPKFNPNNINLTTKNNKIYLNGYEYFYVENKWKRTPKAIWHFISNCLF
jgi:hypothetical protein